ncbi:MAG: bifunctional phosphoglucose/phosphomannose isomerase [bacterium]|nr:bifunctional phosphoglucose/phosphomannose isomerase [bacterium]
MSKKLPLNPALGVDKNHMFDVLYNVPDQIKEAVGIGENAPLWAGNAKSDKYAVFGLGGSAIGADLLRSYAAATPGASHLMLSVNRGYTAPGWVDADTRVVCSSYSGETEETLSAYEAARKKTKDILCITTGGTLAEKATKAEYPVVFIPSGYQPRCALAYAFFPLLTVLGRSGAFHRKAVKSTELGVTETIMVIKKLRDTYAKANKKNPAFALAVKLRDAYPVIYSAAERLDVVNTRWRGQIQENSKQVAFGNYLPEMNHNEINGWQFPKNATKKFKVILMRDAEDHARVKLRFDALADIIKKQVGDVISVEGQGETLLSRMFTLIYLGDWVSWHLAILNGVDPTPVPVIQTLKARLAGR